MYQLMILDQNNNILGAYTNSHRLPDVDEVFPGKGYRGIETPYNTDLIYNYPDYCYKDGAFVKKSLVEYQITKAYITPAESTVILVPKGTTAVIDGIEYEIEDGVIEYSNPNLGRHTILLMLEGYKNTFVYIEVIE